MKKLKLLLFTLFLSGLLLGVNAQDTIRSLIISEWRGAPHYDNYIEFTNVGTETLDLSRFSLAWVNGGQGQFELVEGQWSMTAGFHASGNYTLSGTLAQGETYLIMNVGDALGNDGLPWHNVDLIERADQLVHVLDQWGFHDQAIPEWEVWGKDSVNSDIRMLLTNWGMHANVLFYRLDNGDSVLIDGVNVHLDENLHMIREANDVAGVPEATATHTLVRKANIIQGNMDWKKSKGVDLVDSEWIPIPSTYDGTSFTTAGVHGDFGIDMESQVVDIDKPNAKLTVPWGIYKGDSILKKMTLGPGIGWQYMLSPSIIDSAHSIIQNGDVLTIYAAGNELEQIDFEITVADAAPDQATVYPMLYKADNVPIIDPWGYNGIFVDGYWIPHYYVTVGQPGMDTIGNVPYATRVDSLYKNLDKAPDASWEIVWKDGTVRADLQNGDILEVTSEDGTVVKEYFIDVQEYAADDNVFLGAITWPDKSDFLEGWAGDTIPLFNPTKTTYSLMIPYGTINVPALVAHPQDINAELEIQRAVSLTGSQADRSTVFTVTSQSDSTQAYTVIFQLEKDPAKIQVYKGTPFISEIATNQRSWMGYLEIVNPGNVLMDLSEYMIVRSTSVNAGDAITSLVPDAPTDDDFKYRYRSYVPGFQYHEDTTNWLLNPGILSLDANVNPEVEPGGVFVISMANAGRAKFYKEEQLAIIDKRWANDDGSGVLVTETPANLPRGAEAVFLFRITNNEVLEGTKPVGDPADYELVDVMGDPIADQTWTIAGRTVAATHKGRMRTKPHIYTGARSLVESSERFGTHPDTSDWIIETYNIEIPSQDALPAYIGAHVMDPVTIYLSTVTSSVYLVSDGYAGVQTIQGDLTSTTVESFLGYVDKADAGQVLSVLSGADGNPKDAANPVAGNDTLVVISADGVETTKYALIDLPLDTNAVLTLVDDPSNLTIDINGSEGAITGVVYGGQLKDVVAAVKVPDLAVMNIINGEGNLIPLQIMNYDSAKVDVEVGNDIYFEVVAQDLVTIITYKLEPDALSSDAFVISSIYNVDQNKEEIADIADGTTAGLFLRNIEVVKGATATILSKLGHPRVDGIVSYDDVLKVVSEDLQYSTVYFLTFLNESSPDANYPPEVTLAFSDTTLEDAGTTIMLMATATDDGLPPPPALTSLWEVTSDNASDVVIENADQLSTNVTFNAKGNYTVAISVSDGALTTQVAVTVSVGGVGMDEILAPAMLIYPNPATEKLTLELINMPGNTSIISIYNITGSVVFNTKLSSEVIEIDISAFNAGLYIIKVDFDERTFTQRVEIKD